MSEELTMSEVTTLERATDIVAVVEANPVLVLTDRGKFNQFYEAMKQETDALEVDLTTEKGRKAIASMAYKVARTKTAIDDAGKKLNEEARAKINAVDESRRVIRQQLDDLRDEVRRPLTLWEAAEADREKMCKATIDLLRAAAAIGIEETSDELRARLTLIDEMEFKPSEFEAYLPQVVSLRQIALDALSSGIDRLAREEAERAELERLRAEAIERDRIEAERVAAEQAEREREQAERQDNERRAAEAAAEKARIEAAAKAAEESARREAERIAAEERAAADRAHAEALAAEKRRADELEAARRAEQQQAERIAVETAKREADRAHRGKIMGAVKEAIMECGVDEATAKNIVLAIVGKSIPHVSIQF